MEPRWSAEISGSFGARAAPGAKLVPVGKLRLPGRFTVWHKRADRSLPDLYIEVVVEDGQPLCTSVACERKPGGPSVTGSNLRGVAVERLLRLGVRLVATRDDGSRLTSSEESLLEAIFTRHRRVTEARGRGIRISERHLKSVASVYQQAVTVGAAPTVAVAATFKLSRSAAARQVRLARDREFLEPYGSERSDQNERR